MSEKKTRIHIGVRLLGVITIITVGIIISNISLFNSFMKEFKNQRKVVAVYYPSINLLEQLKNVNSRSVSYMKDWVFVDKDTSSINKKLLTKIHKKEYPTLKQQIGWKNQQWDISEQNAYFDVLSSMDSLIIKQSIIMDKLSYFEDYQNTNLMFELIPQITDKGDIISNSNRVDTLINQLVRAFETKLEKGSIATDDQIISIKLRLTWISILIVLFMIILGYQIFRNILYITTTLNDILKQTRLGLLPDVPKSKRKDEIGNLNDNLQGLINHLQNLSRFADSIGQNKFETNFKLASDGDVLGNALLRMRDNLVLAQKDAGLRQEENTQRNWASQGIAVFNEVIRDNNNSIEELTNAVIEKLVHYTESNVGGFFIVNEEDEYNKFLELKSFYAYDRHKFIQKTVVFGETLIGQCYIENDTIFISDVPDDYISITSGLGSDKPKSIIILPLRFNDKTYGVIELASFKQYEKFKIEFIEKISETIASAISTAKVNQITAKLLEESNEKSKRLEEQEIEAKANITKINEEIAQLHKKYDNLNQKNQQIISEKNQLEEKIQNEYKTFNLEIEKEKEKLQALYTALNKTMPYYEMNVNGDIIFANNLYLQIVNLLMSEVVDSKHIKLLNRDFINTGNYKQIWDSLKKGETISTSIQYLIDGKSKYINEKLVPILDKDEKFHKVIVFCQI